MTSTLGPTEAESLVASLRKTFRGRATRDRAWRDAQLRGVLRFLA